jgi:hypothetical protein
VALGVAAVGGRRCWRRWGVAAGSAAPLFAALWGFRAAWEGHTRRILRWLPRAVSINGLPLSHKAISWQPRRQPMAAVGCQPAAALNHSRCLGHLLLSP